MAAAEAVVIGGITSSSARNALEALSTYFLRGPEDRGLTGADAHIAKKVLEEGIEVTGRGPDKERKKVEASRAALLRLSRYAVRVEGVKQSLASLEALRLALMLVNSLRG